MATTMLWLCLLPLVACSALEDAEKTSESSSGKLDFRILLKAKYMPTV
jgi:hypothetical protein